MHLGRVDLDLDGIADLRKSTRVHADRGELVLIGHHGGRLSSGAIGDDVAVDVAVGAQILNVHDLEGEGVGLIRGQPRRRLPDGSRPQSGRCLRR